MDIDPLLGEPDPLVIPRRWPPPRNEAEEIPRSDVTAVQSQDTSTRREPSELEYLQARGSQRGRRSRGRPAPRLSATRVAAANAERAAAAAEAASENVRQLTAAFRDTQPRVAAVPGLAYPAAPALAFQAPSTAPVLAGQVPSAAPPGLACLAPPPVPVPAYQAALPAPPAAAVPVSQAPSAVPPGLVRVPPPTIPVPAYQAPWVAPVLVGQVPSAAPPVVASQAPLPAPPAASGKKRARGRPGKLYSYEHVIEF